MAITKEQAESTNSLSKWTFAAGDRSVTAVGMTENQARMFASEKTTAHIGALIRVESA